MRNDKKMLSGFIRTVVVILAVIGVTILVELLLPLFISSPMEIAATAKIIYWLQLSLAFVLFASTITYAVLDFIRDQIGGNNETS